MFPIVPPTGPLDCVTMPGQQCMHAAVSVPIVPNGAGIISAVIDSVTPVR